MVAIPPLGTGYGVVQQRAPGEPASSPGQAASAASAQTAVDPAKALLDAALKAAATKQNGLAPLFADLEALAGQGDLPPQVKAAAQALLGLQLSAGKIDAAELAKALARSGVFLEAALAGGQYQSPDLKSALLTLRNVLQNWLGTAPGAATRTPPPPPYPGAMPPGQPPELVSLGALGTQAAAAQVLAQTDAALSRQTMLQIASLPDAAGGVARQDAPQRLMMEIPLLTPLGTAIVALQVERDAHRERDGEEAKPPVWRIGFSVHLEPAGPIHARITQTGERTNVAIVAERIASAEALQQGLPSLQSMLAEAALEPGELNCRLGAPAKAPVTPGRLLDKAT